MEKRRVVYIAHPLGKGEKTREANARHAMRWAAFAADMGYAPIVDWAWLSAFWNETKREDGMSVDISLLSKCDEIWLCGPEITHGMREEWAAAVALGIQVQRKVEPSYGLPIPLRSQQSTQVSLPVSESVGQEAYNPWQYEHHPY